MKDPVLEKLESRKYRLTEDWVVNVKSRSFLLKAGYTTNGITAPKFFRNLMGDGVNEKETWCAIFHDWCFTPNIEMSRKDADELFCDLMKQYKIPLWKRFLMCNVVKIYSSLK